MKRLLWIAGMVVLSLQAEARSSEIGQLRRVSDDEVVLDMTDFWSQRPSVEVMVIRRVDDEFDCIHLYWSNPVKSFTSPKSEPLHLHLFVKERSDESVQYVNIAELIADEIPVIIDQVDLRQMFPIQTVTVQVVDAVKGEPLQAWVGYSSNSGLSTFVRNILRWSKLPMGPPRACADGLTEVRYPKLDGAYVKMVVGVGPEYSSQTFKLPLSEAPTESMRFELSPREVTLIIPIKFTPMDDFDDSIERYFVVLRNEGSVRVHSVHANNIPIMEVPRTGRYDVIAQHQVDHRYIVPLEVHPEDRLLIVPDNREEMESYEVRVGRPLYELVTLEVELSPDDYLRQRHDRPVIRVTSIPPPTESPNYSFAISEDEKVTRRVQTAHKPVTVFENLVPRSYVVSVESMRTRPTEIEVDLEHVTDAHRVSINLDSRRTVPVRVVQARGDHAEIAVLAPLSSPDAGGYHYRAVPEEDISLYLPEVDRLGLLWTTMDDRNIGSVGLKVVAGTREKPIQLNDENALPITLQVNLDDLKAWIPQAFDQLIVRLMVRPRAFGLVEPRPLTLARDNREKVNQEMPIKLTPGRYALEVDYRSSVRTGEPPYDRCFATREFIVEDGMHGDITLNYTEDDLVLGKWP